MKLWKKVWKFERFKVWKFECLKKHGLEPGACNEERAKKKWRAFPPSEKATTSTFFLPVCLLTLAEWASLNVWKSMAWSLEPATKSGPKKKNGEHFPLLRKKPQGIYRGDAVLKQPARELQQAKQLLLWARLSHIMCVTIDVYNSPYNNIPMILWSWRKHVHNYPNGGLPQQITIRLNFAHGGARSLSDWSACHCHKIEKTSTIKWR